MTITNRTLSLLLLFCLALFATGVLLALVVSALDGPRPWLLPALAMVTQVAVLYAGRDALLPRDLADARLRAASILVARVGVTLALAIAIVAATQWMAGRPPFGNGLVVVLWFALLRFAFRRPPVAAAGLHP